MVRSDAPPILTQIVAAKRRDIGRRAQEVPLSAIEERIDSQPRPLNLAGALWADTVRVIAEVKKASPVKGVFRQDFDPVALASTYADSGAAAVSVLTEADHFQGSIEDLELVQRRIRPLGVPVLRKDFIFDEYQVYEARAYGADAILLIVAILEPNTLGSLMELAGRLWLQCLVEVHDERELGVALDAGAEIVGINNRDLRTFDTNLAVTERLARLAPSGKIVVSESGVSERGHVERLGNAGANAVLVGEALVTAADPGEKLRELSGVRRADHVTASSARGDV